MIRRWSTEEMRSVLIEYDTWSLASYLRHKPRSLVTKFSKRNWRYDASCSVIKYILPLEHAIRIGRRWGFGTNLSISRSLFHWILADPSVTTLNEVVRRRETLKRKPLRAVAYHCLFICVLPPSVKASKVRNGGKRRHVGGGKEGRREGGKGGETVRPQCVQRR